MNLPTVVATPSVTPLATTQAVVRTHGAEKLSDSTYWTIHGISFAIVVVAIVWIFVAKGPRRKEAIIELIAEQKAKE
jgi:hypothetical protein